MPEGSSFVGLIKIIDKEDYPNLKALTHLRLGDILERDIYVRDPTIGNGEIKVGLWAKTGYRLTHEQKLRINYFLQLGLLYAMEEPS